jgi:hypothetical protein
MKKIVLTVVLEFEDKISDDNELREVAENVAEAIISHANTAGIAPESSETYLKKVNVKSDVLLIDIQRQPF